MHVQVHGNGPVLDDEILADPEVQKAIKEEGTLQRSLTITNEDRAAFGRVGGAVARLHGDSGFAGSLSFDLQVGSALHDASLERCRGMHIGCMHAWKVQGVVQTVARVLTAVVRVTSCPFLFVGCELVPGYVHMVHS